MNDRQLLELAAKAAGINLEWDGHPDKWQPMYYEGKTYHSFDPLTDDGDALRLAVKLHMDVRAPKCVNDSAKANNIYSCDVHDDEPDPYAATRRAIVRAAAEIGRSMKAY